SMLPTPPARPPPSSTLFPYTTLFRSEAITRLKPTAYVGVPDYLKILLDKAREAGREIKSFQKAVVSGGALFPSLRQEYKERGIRSEEHTSELQSRENLVCRLLLEKKK